jgi:hypothetical protein
MVNDRVYSRLLSCFIFILVLAHVFRAATLAFFLTLPGTLDAKQPTLFRYPSDESLAIRSGEVGQKVWPSVRVEVLTQSGEGVGNISVTAYIRLVGLDQKNHLVNTSVEHSGVFLGVHDRDQYSPFMPPRVYQHPILSGSIVRTDSEGVADFRSLRIDGLVAGEGSFELSFAMNIAEPSASTILTSTTGSNAEDRVTYTVTQTTQVAKVHLLHSIHPRAEVNVPFQVQPILLLLDSDNRPVQGVRCKAITIIPQGDEYTVPSWGKEALRTPQLLLGNVTSRPSDSKGYAFFESLHIRASSLRRVSLEYACDGKVGTKNDKFVMAVSSGGGGGGGGGGGDGSMRFPVHLNITQQPSREVREGEPLARAPVVRIVNEKGVGIEGMRVTAHLKMEAGVVTDYSLGPNSLAEVTRPPHTSVWLLLLLTYVSSIHFFFFSPPASSLLLTSCSSPYYAGPIRV